MSHRGGRKLIVPIKYANGDLSVNVYYYNSTSKIPLRIDKNELKGRPINVLQALIKKGFEEGWFNQNLARELVLWGFNQGLWPDKVTVVYGRL